MSSADGAQMVAILDGQLAAVPVARDGRRLSPRRLSTGLAKSPSWTRDSARALSDRHRLPPGRRCRRTDREIVPRLTWTPKPSTTRTTRFTSDVCSTAGRRARTWISSFEGTRVARVEAHRADLHGARSSMRRTAIRAAWSDSRVTRFLAGYQRRTLRPHLARLRHHHRAESCGRCARRTHSARSSSLERSRARARVHDRRTVQTAPGLTIRAAPSMAVRKSALD